MKIAHRSTFSGEPVITTPTVLGITPDKPVLIRVCAIGQRPITLSVQGLPEGLSFDGQKITGTTALRGCFMIEIDAVNAAGTAHRTARLEVYTGAAQRTPLLGFTSWNAFGTHITQEKLLDTAEAMIETGLCDYGYQYINLDSSWQGEYGGEFDAIQPCDRFPDMKAMVSRLHELGYKAGIYSTPFKEAWGKPKDRISIPGCTAGPRDMRYPARNGGIGKIHKERNNVLQWVEWGMDYLKYDWSPTQPDLADLMLRELNDCERDFIFCVTIFAGLPYADYWKRNCNSWRNAHDTRSVWAAEKEIFDTYTLWQEHSGHGHYYDMDMLSIGKADFFEDKFTDDEKVFQYSARAFLSSPIQLSCQIREASDFELDIFSNEEVIALNQDGLLLAPQCVTDDRGLQILVKRLENGDIGVGMFNASEEERTAEYQTDGTMQVRDVWAKEELGAADVIRMTLPKHSARLFRLHR